MNLDRDYRRSRRAARRQAAGRVMRGQGSRRADRQASRQGLPEDPQLRSRAEDFVHRYTSGDPREGYDEAEAADMFELARANATPQELQEALQATVRRLPPDQQEQVARMLESAGSEADRQRLGLGGAGAGGSGGLGDLLGGLLGGGMGGMMGGATPATMGSASTSPFGALLGGLIGTAGQPMTTPYQQTGDPISSLLGGLLGSGRGSLAQQPMMGGMQGGDLGGLLGGLLGGSSMAGAGSARTAGGDPMGGLMKTILGGMAAYAMQTKLFGQ